MNRRLALLMLLLPGCSLLPDRPYIEASRFPLVATRPPEAPRHLGREALLVRDMRAGPGLDARGLRSIRANGTLAVAPYAEWAAPPAEAVEAALREWLRGSGLFAGVAAPGSRISATLVLESELTALELDESSRTARAAIAALLVEEPGLGAVRMRGQFVAQGGAALQGEGAAASARAMAAALAAALSNLEAELAAILARPAQR
jgi:ABC-type uncharacterized transport system auxiliary subunit